ncbi:MAG: PTS transporter subunit IIC, partial [Clostridium sp.]
VSMISSIITIFIIGYFKLTNIAIIPLTVACFFDAGPAAIFGNATGGRRGAIIASVLSGVLLIVFNVISIKVMGNIVPDFLQAFGGNDFSIWAIIMSLFN